MNAYARSADAYLAQRILGANPVQQAALIMEAGQLHLGKAIRALAQGDLTRAGESFLRVTEVLAEAKARINLEEGGELATSLENLYDWWASEIMAACNDRSIARLESVAQAMGDIRQAWQQLHEKQAKAGMGLPLQYEDQVV